MKKEKKPVADFREEYPVFTPAMKKDYRILVPGMLPWHFEILQEVFEKSGYHITPLKNEGRAVIDEGLKHVHNDACFPALCVIGQFLDALKSGEYDVSHTAVLITQSGGGCRASNYVPLIRRALKAEFPQVPVLSMNFSGLEKQNGIETKLSLLRPLGYAVFYGDLLVSVYNQTVPYEKNQGDSAAARTRCIEMLKGCFRKGNYAKLSKWTRAILDEFQAVPVTDEKKIKVGIVGEIYVKYSPLGNSHLEEFLLSEGCEPNVPALTDFLMYCVINILNDRKLYGHKKISDVLYSFAYRWLCSKQRKIISLTKKYSRYEPLHNFEHLRSCADKVINQGVKMGEGWLIPAEMAALCETGYENIVCTQPFGCLPNHIAGKGASRAVKALYPNANIVPVDYDPSATRVNQENRIKLMLATARERMKNQ